MDQSGRVLRALLREQTVGSCCTAGVCMAFYIYIYITPAAGVTGRDDRVNR